MSSAARSASSSRFWTRSASATCPPPGYEADDIIATLATQASAAGDDVLIVTGDRDTFQLIDDHVTVLYNSRGVSDMKRYDPVTLVEKYGLTPQQYPDFAALRGDPSDNLPSIPGVGEKTATKWIVEFGSLENLVNRVDEVKGKAGDALRANLGNVLRNRQLTQLICDLPTETVGADPGRARPRPVRPQHGPRPLRHPAVPGAARPALLDLPRRPPRRARPGRRRRREPKIKSSGASRSTRPFSPRDRSPPGWTTIDRSNGPGWH